jgi:hypothetical protein
VLAAPVPPARAAILGVPTNLTAAGATTGTTADPPGWFTLSGPTFNAPNPPEESGDAVHQIRLFIEVTGTTLDIRVFDAGTSGAREFMVGGTSTTTVYTLLDPFGTTIQAITIVGDTGLTQDRLARFSSVGTFTAASGGTTFGGLQPGLHEFRIAVTAGDDFNAFGLEIRDGAGNHYNAYTTGQSDALRFPARSP